MNITTFVGVVGLAIALIASLVAVLEHLDCRARERRWQRARDSFTR